jgi:cytoskeletal protein RodZ
MMKVFAAQFFLGLATSAVADDQPLVRCAVPVHVKFIVTPQQLQPEFKVQRPGQKHWSAYKCQMADQESKRSGMQMSIEDQAVDASAAVRRLEATVNASEDDDNETTTTTTTTSTATPTTTTNATATNGTNSTNVTTNTSSTTVDLSVLNETVNAELGGAHCWKTWATGLLSIGLSLSLPVAEAAPGAFMARSQSKRLDELTDVVEVHMPCSALMDPLRDLDGDGELDCKVTQEQNSIAEFVSEVDGTWHVLSAQSVPNTALNTKHQLAKDSITIGGGAWCVDPSQNAKQLNNLAKEQLPLALTKVARFTHDGTVCRTDEPCEATMWSFDLAYPTSSCTPEVVGWVQPCSAKLLPDGTLVLLRGAPVQSGSDARRPPLMATINEATEALSFANGVSAATGTSIEVLLLQKHHSISSGSNDVHDIVEVRQLQSISNSSDEDNETSTTTSPTTSTITANTTTTANTTSNTTLNTTTTTTTGNLTELNNTVNAELGRAGDLRMWSTAFLCLTLRSLVH